MKLLTVRNMLMDMPTVPVMARAKPKWRENTVFFASMLRPRSSTGMDAIKMPASSYAMICMVSKTRKARKQINRMAASQPPRASSSLTYQGERGVFMCGSGVSCGISPSFCRCVHRSCHECPGTLRPRKEKACAGTIAALFFSAAMLFCKYNKNFARHAVMPATNRPQSKKAVTAPVWKKSCASARKARTRMVAAPSSTASIKRSATFLRYHHQDMPPAASVKAETNCCGSQRKLSSPQEGPSKMSINR